jgi:hypothetical protein
MRQTMDSAQRTRERDQICSLASVCRMAHRANSG